MASLIQPVQRCSTMTNKPAYTLLPSGPFYADQLNSGDPYELSNGHAIECLPTGGRGSHANLIGGQTLGSDPDVESAGVDTGYALEPNTLRAPDIAVGNVPDRPGWVEGAPPLAVEYCDTGQDEAELQQKIVDLLSHGTRFIWVVRLVGPIRVEVHQPDQPMFIATPGETLHAPGILRNPVAVEALFDQQAANQATLRNLLQREGYESLAEVQSESEAKGVAVGKATGKTEGKAEGLADLRTALRQALAAKDFKLNDESRQRIEQCEDAACLLDWLDRIIRAESEQELTF